MPTNNGMERLFRRLPRKDEPHVTQPDATTAVLLPLAVDHQEVPRYPYKPLDANTKSIRLLQVLPGELNEAIQCMIRHCDLNLATRQTYTALSYTWDHEKEKAWIRCDETEIPIGQNLARFLHQFRKTNGSNAPWLWIDALAINQHDIQERNHQVAQMRDIYQGAASVIAWMGEATADDVTAFHVLHNGSQSLNDWPWDTWYQLFRKPYWRRVWIIQEFILGKEVHLWCGDLQANAADFKYVGDRINGVHTIRGTLGWRLLVFRELWWSKGDARRDSQLTLRKLSTSFAMSNSTDERDLVYAFLGIANQTRIDSCPIVPDYDKSAAEVLIDVIRNQCDWARPLWAIESDSSSAMSTDSLSPYDFARTYRRSYIRRIYARWIWRNRTSRVRTPYSIRRERVDSDDDSSPPPEGFPERVPIPQDLDSDGSDGARRSTLESGSVLTLETAEDSLEPKLSKLPSKLKTQWASFSISERKNRTAMSATADSLDHSRPGSMGIEAEFERRMRIESSSDEESIRSPFKVTRSFSIESSDSAAPNESEVDDNPLSGSSNHNAQSTSDLDDLSDEGEAFFQQLFNSTSRVSRFTQLEEFKLAAPAKEAQTQLAKTQGTTSSSSSDSDPDDSSDEGHLQAYRRATRNNKQSFIVGSGKRRRVIIRGQSKDPDMSDSESIRNRKYTDGQEELMKDHDFISHLRLKLGVSRKDLVDVIEKQASDLRRDVHVIVAKDYLELRRCLDGGEDAVELMLERILKE